MAIITLLTDYGTSDHYVASLKAKILSGNPNVTIIDISHSINTGDIAHASFVLKSVFRNFPPSTVHLSCVGATDREDSKNIALQIDQHYFIGPDNGLFGLISDNPNFLAIEINQPDKKKSTFPGRDLFAPIAVKLASGAHITDLGKPLSTYKKMIARSLRASKQQIIGHVIRVDHYGNLITNIDKQTFDILVKDRQYQIIYGRETTSKLNDNYFSVDPGNCFAFFNSLDLLEIGINQGNASELLGMEYDSTVMINFIE